LPAALHRPLGSQNDMRDTAPGPQQHPRSKPTIDQHQTHLQRVEPGVVGGLAYAHVGVAVLAGQGLMHAAKAGGTHLCVCVCVCECVCVICVCVYLSVCVCACARVCDRERERTALKCAQTCVHVHVHQEGVQGCGLRGGCSNAEGRQAAALQQSPLPGRPQDTALWRDRTSQRAAHSSRRRARTGSLWLKPSTRSSTPLWPSGLVL
jgi:hypothetical protein